MDLGNAFNRIAKPELKSVQNVVVIYYCAKGRTVNFMVVRIIGAQKNQVVIIKLKFSINLEYFATIDEIIVYII